MSAHHNIQSVSVYAADPHSKTVVEQNLVWRIVFCEAHRDITFTTINLKSSIHLQLTPSSVQQVSHPSLTSHCTHRLRCASRISSRLSPGISPAERRHTPIIILFSRRWILVMQWCFSPGPILAVLLALTGVAGGTSVPLKNRSQLPKVEPLSEIEVHMLEKHVYNRQDVNVTNTSTTRFLALLNNFIPLFHVSLGLRARSSHQEVALEYVAANGLGPAIAPTVEHNGTLAWHNKGQMLVDSTISPERWERALLVAVINATAYNRLADWAVQQAQTVSSYELFTVIEKDGGQTYLSDNTCSTMPWQAFRFLRDSLGCTVAALVPPRRNLVSFITGQKQPEKVDMGDREEQEEVVRWFKHIEFNLANVFFNPAFGNLRSDPQAFIYASGEYWRLHLARPYTAISYSPDPVWLAAPRQA